MTTFTDEELAVLHTLIEGSIEVAQDDKRDTSFLEAMFDATNTGKALTREQVDWLLENLDDLTDDCFFPEEDGAALRLIRKLEAMR
jgi:hypothetical protein